MSVFQPNSPGERQAFNAGVEAARRVLVAAGQRLGADGVIRPHRRAMWAELFASLADDMAMLRFGGEPDDDPPAVPALPKPDKPLAPAAASEVAA